MATNKTYILLLLMLAKCTLGFADSPRPSLSTLVDVINLAKSRNPDIAAARQAWEGADSRIWVAKSLPDLEFGLRYEGIESSTYNLGSAMERWYEIGQTIPFPTKLYYRGKAARLEADRQKELLQGTERDVLARVKEGYYGLMFTERGVEISAENVEILWKFPKIAASKYSVGKASQSDVLRAQVELSKANNMVVTAQQEQETAQSKLNALLDRHPEEPFGRLEEPVISTSSVTYEQLEKLAFERRPELLAFHKEVSRAEAEVSVMKSEYLPDIMLQYGWRTVDQGPSDSMAMIKLNLPLWFWKQKSSVDAAQAEKGKAQEMLRSAQATTRSDVKEFLVHVQTSKRLVELYKTTLLPQAEQSLRVAEAAYQSDRIDFLNLLDSDRALIDFRLEYYRNLAQYGANVAHLERVVGIDLADVKEIIP